jgi:transcriptional regulator with XRE-family HTH domain
MNSVRPVGDLLREWRQRRRLSQLDLACEADISTRHLSFVETGRSLPSRDMVLHLAEQLDVPLRDRNMLLVAAGYAPIFRERPLADPTLHAARQVVEQVLAGHEPNPAFAVDRHWILVASNNALAPLIVGVAPALLQPPVNVLRLSLHPDGLASRIVNLPEWRAHVFMRLRQQIDATADTVLATLLDELRGYPAGDTNGTRHAETEYAAVAAPFRLMTQSGVLAFLTTTTIFGTPVDITLSELAVESLFPADAATADVLRKLADAREGGERIQ